MTAASLRVPVVAAAVVLLGAGALGCGIVAKAKQTVSNVSALSDVADKLGKSSKLTYTAVYKLDDGSTATVVQRPPDSAYIGKAGRFVQTDTALLWCRPVSGHTACQRKNNPNKVVTSALHSQYTTAVAGGGFVSTPTVVGVLTGAAIVPGVKIEENSTKVGGLSSTCLHVTNIPANDKNTSAREFTACVADNGVLTKFTGLATDGKTAGVTLTTFTSTADAGAFNPPAGAKVTDVEELSTP